MPIVDKQMGWKRKRLFFDRSQFNVIGTAGADTGISAGTPLVAAAAGGSEIGVIQQGAAGDEQVIFIPLPWDLDRTAKVLARVWFIHSSTDADTPVWILKSKFHAKQVTVVDMDTSEDVATTFAAHTCSTTAESLEITAWTDLTWESYITDLDIAVGMLLECDNLGSASGDEIELLGLELLYQVEATDQSGRQKTAGAAGENPLNG